MTDQELAEIEASIPTCLTDVREKLVKICAEVRKWEQVYTACCELSGETLNQENHPLGVTASYALLKIRKDELEAELRKEIAFWEKNDSNKCVELQKENERLREALKEFSYRNNSKDGAWVRIGSAMIHESKLGPIVWANIVEAVKKARAALGEGGK